MVQKSTFDRRETDAPSRHEAGVSPRELRMVLIGLMMALALAALDQNIVATALPRITGDLGGFQHLSWVVTAFIVTSTVSAPLYGRLSDLYGSRRHFQYRYCCSWSAQLLAGSPATFFNSFCRAPSVAKCRCFVFQVFRYVLDSEHAAVRRPTPPVVSKAIGETLETRNTTRRSKTGWHGYP
jgi:Major Facilitator Superfamily